jgi:ATP-dependent exoDNAse (exonuclease V) beta subunit
MKAGILLASAIVWSLVSAAQATDRAANIFERKIAEVFTEYQARLAKAGAMDFDDLLVNTVRLLVGAGYNHFEIVEALGNPYGLLGRAVLAQMQLA